MHEDRSRRATQIAAEALERPTESRGVFVAQACGADQAMRGEVESLLGADAAAGSFLDQPAVRSTGDAAVTEADPLVGARIDGFRVIRRLAIGGMGAVYEAQQENPRRRVALKVIRAGAASPESLRRFEHEAHVLARLQHPGIAQVFEAGSFDRGQGAQPFFAMELIEGQPLTAFAEADRLDTRKRLELFARICDAVHYAHQRGVIHRDLKPGNVLVGADGGPKILDFGVARVTDADLQTTTLHTHSGELIGTVPYMSPEQVVGDADQIDTRSDVYALGVMLYELLSGRLPHDLRDKAIPEAARIIREDEITPLSSVNRTFRGDLETVVAKALDRDPQRRYQSAAELAADVRRYLNDEPITARPASAMYQLRKFARRNKAIVVGMAAVFAALLAGSAVATWGLIQARTEAANAETESASLAAVNKFLSDLLSAVQPEEAQGREVTVREVLDEAAEKIAEQFADRSLVEAQIRTTLGRTYRALGEYTSAAPHLQRALELRLAMLGEEHPDTLGSMNNLALLYFAQGRYDKAERLHLKTLETRRRTVGEDDPSTLDSMTNLASVYYRTGRSDMAESLLVKALEMRKRVQGEEHPDTLTTMSNLAGAYFINGRYDEAEPLYIRTLEIRERVLGQEHPDTLASLGNLAMLYKRQGRPEEAEVLYLRTLDVQRRVLGEEHPQTLGTMSYLAVLYSGRGRPDEAEALYRRTLEIQQRVLGEEHPDTLVTMSNLASMYHGQGRYAEAELLCAKALESRKRTLGQEHPDTLSSLTCLASLYIEQGRYDEAEPLQVLMLETQRRLLGEENPATLGAVNSLAISYFHQDRYVEAEPLFLEAIEGFTRVLGEEHRDTLGAMTNLANVYSGQRRYDEAEHLYLRVIERETRLLGAEHPGTLISVEQLALLYQAQGRLDDAASLQLRNLEVRRRVLGDEHPSTLASQTNLANLYRLQRRYSEAERLYLKSVDVKRRVLGMRHPWTRAAMSGLADVYEQQGRLEEAIPLRRELLEYLLASAQEPGAGAEKKNEAAWKLLTAGNDLRNPQAALALALEANQMTGYSDPSLLDTLSLAYHLTGDTASARDNQRKAIALVPPGESDLRAELEKALADFEAAREPGNQILGRDAPAPPSP